MPRPYHYLPSSSVVRRVRLDMNPYHAARLEVLAEELNLSLASFARLLLEMYGNGPLTPEAIKAEVERRRGPLPPPKEKRPRGRPRKSPAGGQESKSDG